MCCVYDGERVCKHSPARMLVWVEVRGELSFPSTQFDEVSCPPLHSPRQAISLPSGDPLSSQEAFLLENVAFR